MCGIYLVLYSLLFNFFGFYNGDTNNNIGIKFGFTFDTEVNPEALCPSYRDPVGRVTSWAIASRKLLDSSQTKRLFKAIWHGDIELVGKGYHLQLANSITSPVCLINFAPIIGPHISVLIQVLFTFVLNQYGMIVKTSAYVLLTFGFYPSYFHVATYTRKTGIDTMAAIHDYFDVSRYKNIKIIITFRI